MTVTPRQQDEEHNIYDLLVSGFGLLAGLLAAHRWRQQHVPLTGSHDKTFPTVYCSLWRKGRNPHRRTSFFGELVGNYTVSPKNM